MGRFFLFGVFIVGGEGKEGRSKSNDEEGGGGGLNTWATGSFFPPRLLYRASLQNLPAGLVKHGLQYSSHHTTTAPFEG